MSQTEDRSGLSPEWVSGLDTLTPEVCRAYLDSLMAIDLKECDECNQVAIYRVSFHGCSRFTVCGLHRAMWASGIARTIQHYGSIVCQVCDQNTYSLAATMQWHAI